MREAPAASPTEDDATVQTLAAAVALAIQNAQLYADAERRERWVRAGQEISTMLLSGVEEEEVLPRIASASREVAAADTAALVLPGVGDDWVMEIVDGLGTERAARDGHAARTAAHAARWRPARGCWSTTSPRPVRCASPRCGSSVPRSTRRWWPTAAASASSCSCAAIGSTPFSETDLATAQAFAGQAALALELAEARHAHDLAALLDERERIARDLHDLAIQQLFATGMQLETVRRRAARGVDPSELTGIVEDALDNVDAAVKQIRSIVHALRDPDAAAPLAERLRREASLARTGLGFAPSLLVTVDGRVLDSGRGTGGRRRRAGRARRRGPGRRRRRGRPRGPGERRPARAGDRGRGAVEVAGAEAAAGLGSRSSSRTTAPGSPPARDRRSGTDNLAARARRHDGTFELTPPPAGRGTRLTWRVPLPSA